MKDYRCVNCGKLFVKAEIVHGKIEHKCKCGAVTTIVVKPEAQNTFEKRLQLQKK